MLITEYVVGRRRQADNQSEEGMPHCIVVNSVLPTDCTAGRMDLVRKLNRKDLIMEFLQDGEPVEWINLPGLPQDVVDLLQSGQSIPVVDESDWTIVDCRLHEEDEEVGAAKVRA